MIICKECDQLVAVQYFGQGEVYVSLHHEPGTPPHRMCFVSCEEVCVGTADIFNEMNDELMPAMEFEYHVGDTVGIEGRGTYTLQEIEQRKTPPTVIYQIARGDESFWTDDSEMNFVSCNHQ